MRVGKLSFLDEGGRALGAAVVVVTDIAAIGAITRALRDPAVVRVVFEEQIQGTRQEEWGLAPIERPEGGR